MLPEIMGTWDPDVVYCRMSGTVWKLETTNVVEQQPTLPTAVAASWLWFLVVVHGARPVNVHDCSRHRSAMSISNNP